MKANKNMPLGVTFLLVVIAMVYFFINEQPAEQPLSSSEVEKYYGLAAGKTGKELKYALNDIIDRHNELTYMEVWDAIKELDENPDNENEVMLLYSDRTIAKSENGKADDEWNREHVWARSHGSFDTEPGPGTDLHHLRPTDVSVNRDRGNLDFDNGGAEHQEARGNFYDKDSWEPRDEVKGDIARMLFYMAVRYEGERGEPDLELNDQVNNGNAPFHGKISVLLQWHKDDPVDEYEKRRNNFIYEDYQHNRNPFIDYPEWAELIWGDMQ